MFRIEHDPRGFRRMTISGKIDAEDMKKGLDAFLATLSDEKKTDFLYEIDDFELPTLNALAVEFRYLPSLFAALPKMGRVAVVSGVGWIRKAAVVEGKVIPGLRIEAFEPEDTQDAIRWLTRDE